MRVVASIMPLPMALSLILFRKKHKCVTARQEFQRVDLLQCFFELLQCRRLDHVGKRAEISRSLHVAFVA